MQNEKKLLMLNQRLRFSADLRFPLLVSEEECHQSSAVPSGCTSFGAVFLLLLGLQAELKWCSCNGHSLYRNEKEVFNLRGQGEGNTISGEKEILIGINLSAVLSSPWQRARRCRGAQLPLRQLQDGLLRCCVLVRSHPAPITSGHWANGVTELCRKPRHKRCPQTSRANWGHNTKLLIPIPSEPLLRLGNAASSHPRSFKITALPEGSAAFLVKRAPGAHTCWDCDF